jgi:hypothetical protein
MQKIWLTRYSTQQLFELLRVWVALSTVLVQTMVPHSIQSVKKKLSIQY